MPGHRTVPAARGLAWITEGLGDLRRTPGPYVSACFLVGLLTSLPLLGSVFGLLMPVFSAGLVSLLRTRAAGGAGEAAQAFDGFRQPGAMARLLPIVAFNLAFALAMIAVLFVAAGPQLVAIGEAMQAGREPTPEQAMAVLGQLVLPVLAMLPVAAFVGWMQLLAIPRAMLDGVHGTVALREAAAAAWTNLGALLLNLLGLMAVMAGLLMAAMVPAMIVGVVQAASPGLALLLQVPLMAALAGTVQAIYGTQMYRASREIFEVDAEVPPDAPAVIEA